MVSDFGDALSQDANDKLIHALEAALRACGFPSARTRPEGGANLSSYREFQPPKRQCGLGVGSSQLEVSKMSAWPPDSEAPLVEQRYHPWQLHLLSVSSWF